MGLVVLGGTTVAVLLGDVLGGERAVNVRAGDCFDALLLGETVFGTSIDPVPCEEASYRAFAALDLTAVYGTWPGVEEVEARARDRCATIAVQSGIDDPTLDHFDPSDEAGWASPAARKVVCATGT